MVLRQDQERIRTLLKDTITLLCRNGLTFSSEFSIEALIGITLDKDDIFLVNINEIVRNEASKVADDKVPGDGNAASSDNESVTSNTSTPRRRRRKRRMRVIKEEPAVSEEESNQAFETQPDLDNSNSQSVTPTTPQHKKSRLNDNSATQLQLKAEPTEDEEDDIVYIKQEMGYSWSEQYQGEDQSHTFTGFGADLSGMSQEPGSSNMSGVNMWSPGGQGQGYQPRQGNATVTGSFTDPGGQATSPGGANNQKEYHLRIQISEGRKGKRGKQKADKKEKYKGKRDKLMKNAKKYAKHKSDDADRGKRYRGCLTPEQKIKYNESAKLRMRRYRERQKERKGDQHEQVLTRESLENRRKMWRESKARQRSKMTSQQRRREKEKRFEDVHEGQVKLEEGKAVNK